MATADPSRKSEELHQWRMDGVQQRRAFENRNPANKDDLVGMFPSSTGGRGRGRGCGEGGL